MSVPPLFDPDTLVDAETDDMLAEGIPETTRATYRREWTRFIGWCGDPNRGLGHPRQHLPATVATVRKYITDHWSWTRTMPDGSTQLAGRYGRPYAPTTVELAIAVISIVHQWAGLASPTRHPSVAAQLRGYETRWSKAGFRPDEAYAISLDDNLAMARSCDLSTVQGIRNAALLRLQFELGCRASELCAITFADLRWETPDRLVVHIEYGKGHKSRDPAVQADKDTAPEWCALLLLRQWIELAGRYGITSGRVFREVNPAKARQDGTIAGSVREEPLLRGAYEMVIKRAAERSGVDKDPVTGEPRHITSHSPRAGLITASVEAGMEIAQIAPHTGHALSSPVIHRYYRSGKRWGAFNPGARVRKAAREARDEQATTDEAAT